MFRFFGEGSGESFTRPFFVKVELHPVAACTGFLTAFNICQNLLGTQVGGHDQDRVLEVHSPALRVCDPAVIKYLQQDIEDIRMGLLYFVKKNDRIRFSADSLSQLASFLVADISGRCSDESGD